MRDKIVIDVLKATLISTIISILIIGIIFLLTGELLVYG
jgi:hypothetical protein